MSGRRILEVLEVFFGILFTGLLESVKDHPASIRITTNLGRLADLLADDLPFICFVLLDGVAQLYGLLNVSVGLHFDQGGVTAHTSSSPNSA